MKWGNYHYFHPTHFTFVEATGTKEECMKTFRNQQEKFPTSLFGTCIFEWDYSDPDNCYVLIRRFVTERTCREHCNFPPTYKREGRAIE
jgi:hypothetical protein